MELKNNRIGYVDLAKGVAVFLMVLCHCGFHNLLTVWIYAFHMPLFWLLSGYLYNGKCNFSNSWLKKKIKEILVPTFLVCGLSCLGSSGWLDYVGILYGSRQSMVQGGVSCNLWFLPCFFLSIVFYSIIVSLLKKNNYRIITFVLLGIVGFMSKGVSLYSDWGVPFSAGTSLVGVLLISIGSGARFLQEKFNLLNNHYLLLGLFILGSFLAYMNRPISLTDGLDHVEMAISSYGNPLLFLLTSTCLSFSLLGGMKLLVCKLSINNLLYFWGKHSLGIYCIHGFVNQFLYILLVVLVVNKLGLQCIDHIWLPMLVCSITMFVMKPLIKLFDAYIPNIIGK